MSDDLRKAIAAILCSACDNRAKLITEPCAACTFSGIHHHYLDTDGDIAFAVPCTASKADEILARLAPAIAEALESASRHEAVIIGSGAKVACRGCDWKPVGDSPSFSEHIRALTPASILRDAERSKLEARLDERQNQPDCGCFQYVGKAQRKCNRCIELESQIAALSSPVGEG